MLKNFICFLNSFEFFGNITSEIIEIWLINNHIVTGYDDCEITINHYLTYSVLEINYYDEFFQINNEFVIIFDNNKHYIFKNTMFD